MSEKQSVYIHIPFCIKKCFYCDFYSISDLLETKNYIKNLIKEISLRSNPNLEIDTIYFGGGTPSVLELEDIEEILINVSRSFIVSPEAEITLELNPGTADRNYLKGLKSRGINRLSVGVQSFNDKRLQFLQRVHDANDAINILSDAQNIGFDNIGLDLIYGLPKDNIKETGNHKIWLKDLDTALEFTPQHISCYMLTFEPGTPMYEAYKRNLIKPLANNDLSKLFVLTSNYLEANGYIHYEISNYAAKETFKSKHNSKYWKLLPYMGFGVSAHSFQGSTRSWNHADIDQYIQELEHDKLPVSGKEKLNRNQQLLEIIMLGLRTLDGVDIRMFNSLAKEKFELYFKDILARLKSDSLGEIKDKRLLLTLEGRTYLNSITQMFANKIL